MKSSENECTIPAAGEAKVDFGAETTGANSANSLGGAESTPASEEPASPQTSPRNVSDTMASANKVVMSPEQKGKGASLNPLSDTNVSAGAQITASLITAENLSTSFPLCEEARKMAEKIETEKFTSKIEELVARTITLTRSIKATHESTKQLSQQAKAKNAEMRGRRYDEDAEIAKNIFTLRELSKENGAMSFKAICDRLDRQRNECTRLADNHGRFMALLLVYQQALRQTHKKATEVIIAKIDAIKSKAASEGKDPDLEYVCRELKTMCGRAGKQNDSDQNPFVKATGKAVDAQKGILAKRKLAHDVAECAFSKAGIEFYFEYDGKVPIRCYATMPVQGADVVYFPQSAADAA